MMGKGRQKGGAIGGLLVLILGLLGCDDPMLQQPRYDPYEKSSFFEDNRSARPIPPGTEVFQGDKAQPAESLPGNAPPKVTEELLLQGKEHFEAYCSPCHGRDGYGEGMVVLRGFPHPPSYHSDRLRQLPDSHIYSVIVNGLGKMPSFGTRIEEPSRWAIIAYIRALQLSQYAPVEDVPPQERPLLAPQPARERP